MSHGAHVDANDPFQKRVAVALAVYTVVLALANMLTNQSNSQGIIASNETTSKWNYYQAKSNKQNIIKAETDIVALLLAAPNTPSGNGDLLAKLKSESERYDTEKAEIQKEAKELEHKGQHLQHKAHLFEYGSTIAELAIVIGGISLLVHSKKTLYASAAIASVAIAIIAYAAVS
jgi:hypothetical protein